MSHSKLKICGVTSAKEAQELVRLGVDFIGLNFIPTSSRVISLQTAGEIMKAIEDSAVQAVLLFADQPLEVVNEYAAQLGADYVQLHGNETPEYIKQVSKPVMKAIAVSPADTAADLSQRLSQFEAAYFVLDRAEQGQGAMVDIELGRQIAAAHPDQIFFAGGVNPGNIGEIAHAVQPYGIDIAGGVRTKENKLDFFAVRRCVDMLSSIIF